MSRDALFHLWNVLVWGFVATAAMTTILQGSQGLGLSRLSLPFLLGTVFTAQRRRANLVGFGLYMLASTVVSTAQVAMVKRGERRDPSATPMR